MVHCIGPFNSKVQKSVFPYGGCTHYSCNPPKQGRIDEHDCKRPSAPPTRAHAQCSRKVMNRLGLVPRLACNGNVTRQNGSKVSNKPAEHFRLPTFHCFHPPSEVHCLLLVPFLTWVPLLLQLQLARGRC